MQQKEKKRVVACSPRVTLETEVCVHCIRTQSMFSPFVLSYKQPRGLIIEIIGCLTTRSGGECGRERKRDFHKGSPCR